MKTKKTAIPFHPIVEDINSINELLKIAADATRKADTLIREGKKEVLHEKTGTTHKMTYMGHTIFIKPASSTKAYYNVYKGIIGKSGKIVTGECLIKNSYLNLDSIKHNLRFCWVEKDGTFAQTESFSEYSW